MTSSKRREVFLGQFLLRLEPVFEVVAEDPAMLPVDFVSPPQQILDRSRVVYGKAVQIDSLGFRFISDLVASEHVQKSFPPSLLVSALSSSAFVTS
jgi:hypothetical protein